MTEFWLISAPGEKTSQQTWETLNSVMSKHVDLCNLNRIAIPDLKVGTLDTLIGLSDDLQKLDQYIESLCLKLSSTMKEVLENAPLAENLHANNENINEYLRKFQWSDAKFAPKNSLTTIHDMINKMTGHTEADLKNRLAAYNAVKTNLQTLGRNQSGSLLVKNLGDLVKEDDFVLDSEYLTTLLVIVPKALFKEWIEKYESLHKYVVPQSSFLLHQDNDHGLYNVTIVGKFTDEFKQACRENKFTVRDFHFSKQEIEDGKNKLRKLVTEKDKTVQSLLRWLKTHFSETYISWCHVKILRLFVDSVLRYGLPVNFVAVLIEPNKKQTKKLRSVLNAQYAHLDTSFSAGPLDDIPGLNVGQQEYYPYVFLKVNTEIFLSDHSKF